MILYRPMAIAENRSQTPKGHQSAFWGSMKRMAHAVSNGQDIGARTSILQDRSRKVKANCSMMEYQHEAVSYRWRACEPPKQLGRKYHIRYD
ncbi:hypothetical protein ElyMa_004139100 [Elysia marginata]|uniref:Uncharacterized protein n=1 Tax=Elysia marginata TaxID=1093978 RepID=A0AAV4GDZ7_9GAST|nr:hypothetical protein ElyMa_004139100 [Elysia marginata]